ncbi:MAG: Ig-like domain-containing protein, partial [Methylococcales bacterium]|nr:Ig-like domain-containing protein [Methylococcales bacterium]
AVGVRYSVNGSAKTWGSVTGPLAVGASVTIGTNGAPYAIPSGNYTMTAFADDVNRFAELDETNNQLSKPVSGGVTDTQPPTVSITAPTSNATVTGSAVTISANAADNVGVAGVQFLISGAYSPPEDTTAPYAIAWDSTAVADGIHTIKAVARDAAGNTTTSTGVDVTVNNTTKLPDVIVTALSYSNANGTFTSTVMNQGTAATPAGVYVGVRYSVDGTYKTWGSVIGPLAAGATITIGTNGGSYAIPTGTHTVTAWVDDVNRFAELNETNNQLTRSITIP